jgi:hypothetical protein
MGQLFSDSGLTVGKSSWNTYKYSYAYDPAVGNFRGAAIASQYAAEFFDDIDNSSTGRTIRGVVKDVTGIDRLPCNSSGTYQDLEVKVYYNTNY